MTVSRVLQDAVRNERQENIYSDDGYGRANKDDEWKLKAVFEVDGVMFYYNQEVESILTRDVSRNAHHANFSKGPV